MKNNDFFAYVRKTLRRRKIIESIIYTVIAALFVRFSVYALTDADSAWQIGVRGSRTGIPVPGWFVALFGFVIVIFSVVALVSTIMSLVKDEDYNLFLEKTLKVGDANTINESLSKTEKSPYSKDELRFDDKYLFYMEGTSATVIEMSSILHVRPLVEQYKNTKSYYIAVYYGKTGNNVLKICAKKKNVQQLGEAILAKLA